MDQVLKKAGKKPGDIVVGGIDLAPGTIGALKSGYVSATLDQLLYLQGFMPVVQCVMTAKYKMPGLSLNTGAGAVTPKTIDALDQADRRGHPLRLRPRRRGAGGQPPAPLFAKRAWIERRSRRGSATGRDQFVADGSAKSPARLLVLRVFQPPVLSSPTPCSPGNLSLFVERQFPVLATGDASLRPAGAARVSRGFRACCSLASAFRPGDLRRRPRGRPKRAAPEAQSCASSAGHRATPGSKKALRNRVPCSSDRRGGRPHASLGVCGAPAHRRRPFDGASLGHGN